MAKGKFDLVKLGQRICKECKILRKMLFFAEF